MTDHYKSRASTHADGCWDWGPAHYECALREIELLRKMILRAHDQHVQSIARGQAVLDQGARYRPAG